MDDASQLFLSFPLVPFPSPARRHVPHVFLCFACQTAYPVPRRWVIKRTPIIQLPYRRASSRSEPGHFFKLFFISYFFWLWAMLCFASLCCWSSSQTQRQKKNNNNKRARALYCNNSPQPTGILVRIFHSESSPRCTFLGTLSYFPLPFFHSLGFSFPGEPG